MAYVWKFEVLHGVCAVQALVSLMMEEDRDTLMACWTALAAVVNSILKELQPSYVRTMREAVQVRPLAMALSADGQFKPATPTLQLLMRYFLHCLQTARDKERRKRKPGPLLLAGFCLPKALQPVLPIYLQGMLQVSGESFACFEHNHCVGHNHYENCMRCLQGICEQACFAGIFW